MAGNPRERFQEMAGKSPEEATFFWTGGPIEVARGTYFASLFSGCTAFDTEEGVVLVDTGMKRLSHTLAGLLRNQTSAPLHTVLYTHGHFDHAFGLEAFLLPDQPRPRVIGHRNMPARFRRYARTQAHNRAVNARQFSGTAEAAADEVYEGFGAPPTMPDTYYDDELAFEVGGVRFEIHHAKGETDDHSWLYCPDRGVLCTGDLFIWSVPNCGNPQKVQRYPWEWARALRAMIEREPRTLCPGHGGPVIDNPELIRRMLLETAEYLEAIVERTLAAMEDGSPPHVDVVRKVELPRSRSPWLQPVYDEAEFIVRNVVRAHGGWYSGRPCELKPAPRQAVARELAALAGGASALLERATRVAHDGDMALACHLADLALEADPGDASISEGVAALYEERAAKETSLMAINLYRSAAAYARQGRPFA
jgi:glyoxylase-like metal-dependent hydrolase (beta-lactamase superfamily II)